MTNFFSYKTQANSLAWSAVFHSAEKAYAYCQSQFVSAAASCFCRPIGHWPAEAASRDKLGLAYVHGFSAEWNDVECVPLLSNTPNFRREWKLIWEDYYRRIPKTTRRCIKNSMMMISVIFKILLNSIICFLHISLSYFRVQGIIKVVVF